MENTNTDGDELKNISTECCLCGKVFGRIQELNRHKNKKTPCLIKDVTEEHKQNPNRCVFCNKILSKKEHLTRHLKVCRIKNNGAGEFDEKNHYEQAIRELREYYLQELQQLENKVYERLQQMQDQIDQLKLAAGQNLNA